MPPYTEIKSCRICGNTNLVPVLHLGTQALTGVFPKNPEQVVTTGPLELVKCAEDAQGAWCGLLQLRQSYRPEEMYGENYGYRSGLNKSMVEHLETLVKKITSLLTLESGDLVIDIASNDATLLKFYQQEGLQRVGIDPTAKKFQEFYPPEITAVAEFFSADAVRQAVGDKKAKVITAIAMFYDLEEPLEFLKDVAEVLADDGIAVFEQSYMPLMLEMNSYDTICHEHIEYYRLKQIKWMTDHLGLKILDVGFNDVNGGSFIVTLAKQTAPYQENTEYISSILKEEEKKGLHTAKPYAEFAARTFEHRDALRAFISQAKSEGKKIGGYGASTKGNVTLQFCGIGTADIPYIAEVNADKFGRYTPQTNIPIISEAAMKGLHPDYLVVLPWHFKNFIVQKEKDYLERGGKLVFPLPNLHVVDKNYFI